MSSEPTQFGAVLKRYRTAAGLTQEALAEPARLSAGTIADPERGINRVPRHDTLELLIEALNLTAPQGPCCYPPYVQRLQHLRRHPAHRRRQLRSGWQSQGRKRHHR